jgi:Bacterial Ig-like domain (group 2)
MRHSLKLLALCGLVLSPLLARAQFGCGTITGVVCASASTTSVAFSPTPAQVGIAYSQGLSAVGSSGALTWTIVTGAATQNGLTMNVGSTATITGTPTNGNADFWVVKWVDSSSPPRSAMGSINLAAGTITAINVTPATVNVNETQTQQFSALAQFSNGGASTVTTLGVWTLPSGAGCSGSSITSGGGLATAGTTPGNCTVQISFGGSAGTATMTVLTPTNVINIQTNNPLPNGQVNQPYSESGSGNGSQGVGMGVAITATGGTPPYTCSVTSGSLPAGLALSNTGGNTNCLIGGTPTTAASGSSFTIQVADSASHSNTKVLSSGITVASLSSQAVTLVNPNLTPSTSTQALGVGTYSDGSTAALPNAVSGGAMPYASQLATVSAGTSLTFPATTTTTGDTAVIIVSSYTSAHLCTAYTVSASSTGDGTFGAATTALGESSSPPPYYNCGQMLYAYNITGSSDAPTVTWTVSVGGVAIIQYYHGMLTTNPLDQHPTPTQASSTASCIPTAVTTTAANEVGVLGCLPNSPTSFASPAGYTAEYTSPSNSISYFDTVYNAIQTSITPTATFSPGSQPEVTLFATFKSNVPTAGGEVWTSGTPGCATVSNTGLVTGQPSPTTCTSVITGTVGGSVVGTATVTVTVSNNDTGIVISPASASVTIGGTQQFTALGNVTGNTYTATWGSSNTNVATVNASTGLATCVAAGTASISGTTSGFSSASATLNCSTATVYGATNCGQTAVLAALQSANAANSVVLLPSCGSKASPFSWTSQISYTVPSSVTNLTIEGSTTVACTGTPGTSNYACVATDNTVIADAYQSSSPILLISTGAANTSIRITGITWQGGNIVSSNNTKYNGMLQFYGSSQNFRIDHCHFDLETYTPGNNGAAARIYGSQAGVLDHNLFDLNTGIYPNQGTSNGVSMYNNIGDTVGQGDGSWASATSFGTSIFIFLEANVFNGGAPVDCALAGRYVLRYNNIYNAYVGFQDHATDTGAGGPARGCRAFEVYHNYFSGPSNGPSSAGFQTGASSLLWGNQMPSGFTRFVQFTTDRATTAYAETATPNGWGYCGTDVNGTGSNWDGNQSTVTGYPCLDMVGRGKTQQVLNGATSMPSRVNTSTNSIAWPQQYLEPVYLFDNTLYAGATEVITSDPVTGANRDYYADNSSFTGATGTGTGVLASRPSTCTAGAGGTYATSPTGSYGVGYFATDTNTLYFCTATNTWSTSPNTYTPYPYPHPLDTGP